MNTSYHRALLASPRVAARSLRGSPSTVSGHKWTPSLDRCLWAREVHPSGFQVQGALGKRAAIGVAETAVDTEQDHRLERLIGLVDDRAELGRLEHALPVLLPVGTHDAIRRFLERRAEPRGLSIRPASMPYLNIVRTICTSLPSRERRRAWRASPAELGKSSAARSSTSRVLPNDPTTNLHVRKVFGKRRGLMSPASRCCSLAVRK